jgi:hypothetical protein
MFPNPEEFNPFRWLKPEYPTYKEPLSQYPTIINMTQFGYGRRICQGQALTDADLIVGIGALAWLFNIEKESKEFTTDRVMMNDETFSSKVEMTVGLLEDVSHDTNDPSHMPIGSGSLCRIGKIAKETIHKILRNRKPDENKVQPGEDETLNFTNLLIAKPLPLKLKLSIRDEQKAQLIQKLFEDQRSKGEFVESKEYCKKSKS